MKITMIFGRKKPVPDAWIELRGARIARCARGPERRCHHGALNADRRLALGEAVSEIRAAAAGLGAAIWDRRQELPVHRRMLAWNFQLP